ncbi:MAG: tRNA glutamyl-Q(34) synthetase GluQRS [Pseudohongiella sp.]|nr:tRNA glutamyl-Q(34) synthetase GluQRS [Pseudohongiella sp.]
MKSAKNSGARKPPADNTLRPLDPGTAATAAPGMMVQLSSTSAYIGRFAPSPTGALHFGSLLAALASFLDARANQGSWLLRMEDLDPSREPVGAAKQILDTLESFGLFWDGPVVYQSSRLAEYQKTLSLLAQKGLTYECDCSRQRTRANNGIYDNQCRHRTNPPPADFAIRLQLPDISLCFDDRIQGHYQQHLPSQCGDVVLRRRDGLIAYQLAVVVDDAWQGVTDIVRGFDLIDSTPRQIALQQLLQLPTPRYAHIPVACNSDGQKLSKQHFAKALEPHNTAFYLREALGFLGQDISGISRQESTPSLLQRAIERWDIQRVPKLANIPVGQQLG